MATYKVVDTDKLDSDLSAVANSIRAKTGTSDSMAFPDGFISAVDAIYAGGADGGESGEFNVPDFFARTLTEISHDGVTSMASWALASYNALTSANFPACKNMGQSAFYYCTSLNTAIFPACESIGQYAFAYCSSLAMVDFTACKSMGQAAFYQCKKLTSIDFPSCETIGSSAFYSCSYITTARFPKCTTINSNAFASCYRLSALILEGSTVCTLKNSNALYNTALSKNTAYASSGHIYVPSSLIASYQAASVWSYFSSCFSAIESM